MMSSIDTWFALLSVRSDIARMREPAESPLVSEPAGLSSLGESNAACVPLSAPPPPSAPFGRAKGLWPVKLSFADEIGAGMVAVALSYTGFVTLLAAENFQTCAQYLLDRGVPRKELEGVSSYRFVRGAEAVLRRTNDVDAAVAYLRDVRERRGHFVRSFSSGAKTYTPWWKNAPAPPGDASAAPVSSSAARPKASLTPAQSLPKTRKPTSRTSTACRP